MGAETDLSCPTCSSSLLRYSRAGIQLDSCTHCYGVWLDHGELEEVIKRRLPVRPRGDFRIIPFLDLMDTNDTVGSNLDPASQVAAQIAQCIVDLLLAV